MHGRPRQRAGVAPSPMDKQEQAHVAELRKLMPLFMESNRTCCYSTESLNQSARLLELNPDFLTAWNYRKRAVQHLWELESDEEARKRIAQTELDLVVRALRANPKCYGGWYHRKWIIRFGLSSLDAEFLLLKKLLKLDARNFHGWDYRRFVAKTKGVAAEEELRFTIDKINENFSNYSAWHNRSALLSEISKRTDTKNNRVQESLEEEYELVKTAFYTDPDDQSGWFYYSWLLGQTVAPVGTLVNGCWPPAESQIAIDSENNTHKLPFNKLHEEKLEALPLVLSFSNAVTGVNNRTVSVSVDGNDALELDWRPAEPWCKYGLTWTTDILHLLPSSSRQYAVHILVGAVPGIVSVDGQECASSWKSRFHILLGGKSPLEDESSVEEQVNVNSSEVTDGSEIWQLNILDREIQSCRELLELESNSKWTMLTLARLLLTHASYNSSSRKSHLDEARTHFEVLASLDTTHREYYQHQSSLLSLKELTEDSSNLRRQYEQSGELQLQQLSLCSVEFTERFLWVQNLDLSHNQLRSTHGLEALQVLVNLNLSHNRIGSVTALAPLRELPLLKDVDVSFNQIGDHTVDTCRVLCSSKLTNAASPTPDYLEVGERWETKTVFGGLRWRTLNIAGNSAAEDVQFVNSLSRTLDGTKLVTDGTDL